MALAHDVPAELQPALPFVEALRGQALKGRVPSGTLFAITKNTWLAFPAIGVAPLRDSQIPSSGMGIAEV
jgi:hypothetical protein